MFRYINVNATFFSSSVHSSRGKSESLVLLVDFGFWRIFLFVRIWVWNCALNLPVRSVTFFIHRRKALPWIVICSSVLVLLWLLNVELIWFLILCIRCFLELFLSILVPLADIFPRLVRLLDLHCPFFSWVVVWFLVQIYGPVFCVFFSLLKHPAKLFSCYFQFLLWIGSLYAAIGNRWGNIFGGNKNPAANKTTKK